MFYKVFESGESGLVFARTKMITWRIIMYIAFVYCCIVMACGCIWANEESIEMEAAIAVPNIVMIMGTDHLQSKMLTIDDTILFTASLQQMQDQNSYTIISQPTQICVYSNNYSQGISMLIEPQATLGYSANDFGLNQEVDGTSRLQFFNREQQIALPFFIFITPNKEAENIGLLGELAAFTVGGFEKPSGSLLRHLQVGNTGAIDHYDVQSITPSNSQILSCPGVAIVIQIAILNKDLLQISSGTYITNIGIQFEAID